MNETAIHPGDRYVMLVEDNPDDAELTLRAFTRHKLVNKVLHFPDGIAALDFLFARNSYSERDPSHLPSLVLLDISMPLMDGHEVLRAMRSSELTHNVPVVMLTSSDEQRDIVRAYDQGANSYVRKPVDFAEFLEAAGQLGIYWMLLNLPPQARSTEQ